MDVNGIKSYGLRISVKLQKRNYHNCRRHHIPNLKSEVKCFVFVILLKEKLFLRFSFYIKGPPINDVTMLWGKKVKDFVTMVT